ncbi:hypothetical protein WOC76_08745 [Methylocystis sp. IM3]|uniref:hypothetical protein n=1 Tax=unclassified Methylocystis TaxID=2625913 RepID=UPI0030FC4039
MKNWHVVASAVCFTSASSVLLASSFSLLPALLVLGGVAAVNILFAGGNFGAALQRPVEWRWLATCAAVALLLTLLGGEGHLFFSKDDWLGRDAVLADLVGRSMPVLYHHEGGDFILRAPLGMYLFPAAIGRIAGLPAAHLAMAAQTTGLLSTFFYAVTLVWPRGRLAFIFLFVCFSGLDSIPVLLKTGAASLLRVPAFWVDIGYFPPNLAQFFWAPPHALPGWWFAALAGLYVRREIDLAALAAASLPLLLWSPLALMGGVLIFIPLALLSPREIARPRVALACMCAAGFLPVLAYLRAGAEDVPHRLQVFDEGFLDQYLLLVIFGLTQIAVVFLFWKRIGAWFRPVLAISVILLLLIPLFSMGYMNDVTQRVSIAPRALLAFGYNALLIECFLSRAWLALASGALVVLISAISPALELYDTLTTPRFSISDCNLLTVYRKHNHDRYLPTYIAAVESFPSWLFPAGPQKAALEVETRLCWPDRIYGEKLFNWLKPENRIWLRAPSPQELAEP